MASSFVNVSWKPFAPNTAIHMVRSTKANWAGPEMNPPVCACIMLSCGVLCACVHIMLRSVMSESDIGIYQDAFRHPELLATQLHDALTPVL